jgi:hypothetical protein
MAERQKQNAVQRRDPTQKQSLIDLHSNNDLTPPTIDPHQMVRATASSPSDKSHLRTLSVEERSTSETNLMDLNKGHSPPKNSDETQQSMSLIKKTLGR